jgi:hypothetical protein
MDIFYIFLFTNNKQYFYYDYITFFCSINISKQINYLIICEVGLQEK